jgi:hypothetical protein
MGFKGLVQFSIKMRLLGILAAIASIGLMWLVVFSFRSSNEPNISPAPSMARVPYDEPADLEIDSVNEVEAINAGTFQPWTQPWTNTTL